MRYLFLSLIMLIWSNLLLAQSGHLRFLVGVKESSWWPNHSYIFVSDESWTQVDKTKPLALGTYDLIYSNKLWKKWDWCLGLSFNSKGFEEIGRYNGWPINKIFNFREKRIHNFIGDLFGVRYNFFNQNKWHISAELLNNLEHEVGGYGELKKLTVFSLLLVTINRQLYKNISLELVPNFGASLMNYKNSLSIYPKYKYIPYEYGLMCGVRF